MDNDLELQIQQLREGLQGMGARADEMLNSALRAFTDRDLTAAESAIAADADVDRTNEQIQHGVLAIVALHGPVGHDLRVLTGMIHISLHVERMADYAVNTARAALAVSEFPWDLDLTEQIGEMGSEAANVARQALRSFREEDVALAHQIAELDDSVDRYDRGIFQRLVRLGASDDAQLDWAGRMIRVSRHLERYADHGVDIAEQTIFVATGESVDLGGRHVG